MQIFLPDLKAHAGEAASYIFQENMADCYKDFPEGGNLKLSIRACYSGNSVMINGRLEVEAPAVCSRCLATFNHHFASEFSDVFAVSKSGPADETTDELALETAEAMTVKGDYLYLDEYIRQMIILAQEYYPLCRPDCRGICAGCGVDLNYETCRCREKEETVDVRLLKLKEFGPGDK
ncbi:MAG TPA: DUF177 domain-containing protein [Firmicutes bacterium]|nr:DUF177 domain-containing protein [Bacillota bacterium]